MVHTTSVRRRVRGFTLVELLVVTLILSILMAVALPLYLSAVADSKKKTNRANMQTIANAVQAKYVKDGTGVYFTGQATGAALPDLQSDPQGPDAGTTYTVVAPGTHGGPFYITCSDTNAGTFEPGYDHN